MGFLRAAWGCRLLCSAPHCNRLGSDRCAVCCAVLCTPQVKRRMAEVKPEFWVIDARKVAEQIGLGKHVNMVMQTVFFQLSGVLPIDKAIALLKTSIAKAYGKKGPEVGAAGGLKHQWSVVMCSKSCCDVVNEATHSSNKNVSQTSRNASQTSRKNLLPR